MARPANYFMVWGWRCLYSLRLVLMSVQFRTFIFLYEQSSRWSAINFCQLYGMRYSHLRQSRNNATSPLFVTCNGLLREHEKNILISSNDTFVTNKWASLADSTMRLNWWSEKWESTREVFDSTWFSCSLDSSTTISVVSYSWFIISISLLLRLFRVKYFWTKSFLLESKSNRRLMFMECSLHERMSELSIRRLKLMKSATYRR